MTSPLTWEGSKRSSLTKYEERVEKLSDYFKSNKQLFVSVLSYSLSHGVLELSIHQDVFFKGLKIVCGGCFYFCGKTEGGPYVLSIIIDHNKQDDFKFITIKSDSSDLVIKCMRLNEPTSVLNKSK